MNTALMLPAILRLVVILAWLSAERFVWSQILVGPTGVTNTFDTLPPVSQWSSRVTPGGGSDLYDAAGVDAAAMTNVAANIGNPLTTSTINPPATSASAPTWSTNGYIQTRPAGVRLMLLLATLRNDTAQTLSSLEISYDFALLNFGPAEEVPGHRIFFSLAGQANDWQLISGLSGDTSSGRKTALLNLGAWPPGASLYVLWVDDNSATGVDQPLQIDNFVARPASVYPVITRQPVSQSTVAGGSVTFRVEASGPGTLSYQWRKDGVDIGGATGTNYTLPSAQGSDVGRYSVRVANPYGWTLSADAFLAVGCFANVGFAAQPQSQTLPAGGTISLGAAASGTPPFRYQWYRDGVALPDATTTNYTKANATRADSGYYHLVATACGHSVASVAAAVGVGGPAVSLVGLTNHFWRYEQSGNDLGTLWREPGFDDSSWLIGRGVLANDTHPFVAARTNTVLARTNLNGTIITHYFRTHFTLTNDPHEVTIVASNLIDDGAIVYLNGREVYRFNMPGGAVTATTLASQSALEGEFIVAPLPANLFLPGDNVLAVEVHQVSDVPADWVDVVFGLSLTATFPPPEPLVITNQPASVTIEETRTVAFSVGVQGQPAFFQWYRNGVPIPNATTNPLVIPSASTNDVGSYVAVITNAFNRVASAAATLIVSRELTLPVIVEADGVTPTNVLVTFSEPVSQATATNVANYRLTNTLGGSLAILRADLQNNSNVWLTTTTPLTLGLNYLLRVSNVRDVSPQANVIVSNSQRPVRRTIPVMRFDSVWRWYDPFPPFDNPNLGTSWKDFNYVETNAWSDGAGVFYTGPDEAEVPGTINYFLSQTPELISYFRSGFDLSASSGGLRYGVTHIIDDGGILYLNGRELLRINMPPGAVDYRTPAATAVGTIPRVGPIWLDGPLPARLGSNVLAFELHQIQSIDGDKAFGLQLDASVQSYVIGNAIITGGPENVTVVEGGTATFSVIQAGGATFQWQQNGNAIVGGTNWTHALSSVPLSLDGTPFRVAVSNATSGMFSTNALLRVLPDTNPPFLLSAVGSADNTILLTFSEPLNAASAGTISNYAVVTASGQTVRVTNVTLTNGTNVLLILAADSVGAATVVVNNLRDTAAAQNVMAPNSSVPISAEYFIPMTSAWKYLLINTNAAVQASFMQPDYDDSAWPGPSNALLYVEGAPLPAPKNTPLALRDPAGNPINTFYFRQNFFAPFAAPRVNLQLRHIIDDGMVLHGNGREIFRFNMPAGPVTAGTRAASTISDATLVGPINLTLTNFIAGTNVFAVEVHQTGSADIVMGVEMSIQVPGVTPSKVANPPVVRPYLELLQLSQFQFLYWTEPGFTLECANDVAGPWLSLPGTSPYVLSVTNGAAFYRLRQ